MPTRSTARKTTAAKAKPAPAPEEDYDEELVEEEVDDLEEMEADEAAESKPKKKSSSAQEVTFGIQDLVALVKKETGADTDGRALRTLIRRMARDGSKRINREIVPGNRTRYDWSGPNDPEVVAIVKAFKGGELEVEKQEKLAKLKEDKAKKAAAKKKAAVEDDTEEVEEKPATRRRTAAKKATPTRRTRKAPEPVEEVEDDEELDLDDDE